MNIYYVRGWLLIRRLELSLIEYICIVCYINRILAWPGLADSGSAETGRNIRRAL